MALTLDQFGNLGLTAGQKNKLQQFATIGKAHIRPGPGEPQTPPDISMVTLSQAKTVQNFINDVQALLAPMKRGADYVRGKMVRDAANTATTTLENNNPAGEL